MLDSLRAIEDAKLCSSFCNDVQDIAYLSAEPLSVYADKSGSVKSSFCSSRCDMSTFMGAQGL
jgi:hypothetical protein